MSEPVYKLKQNDSSCDDPQGVSLNEKMHSAKRLQGNMFFFFSFFWLFLKKNLMFSFGAKTNCIKNQHSVSNWIKSNDELLTIIVTRVSLSSITSVVFSAVAGRMRTQTQDSQTQKYKEAALLRCADTQKINSQRIDLN